MTKKVTIQVTGVDKFKEALGEYLQESEWTPIEGSSSFVLDLHRRRLSFSRSVTWTEADVQTHNNELLRDYFRERGHEPLPTDAECQTLISVYHAKLSTGVPMAFSDLLDGIIYGGKGAYETKSTLHLADPD